ncbi:MAG: hypothetical protein HPY30_16960 [Gammaproteobacteria bacterium (ex Lamellibrachia satsuma)]|nr:MAG: hypothetical protein HPY30_16960 [Gammaproteobacteria bacterium (ex Lamellibrachia satsuma)]
MGIDTKLIHRIRVDYQLDWQGIHGVSHWSRVRQNGLRLAVENIVDTSVIELFSVIHDSCRVNDTNDPEHGPRAARYAEILRTEGVIRLTDGQMQQLTASCEGHTRSHTHADMTIATCWDADRLDLGRVGIRPDPQRMATQAGALLAKTAEYL